MIIFRPSELTECSLYTDRPVLTDFGRRLTESTSNVIYEERVSGNDLASCHLSLKTAGQLLSRILEKQQHLYLASLWVFPILRYTQRIRWNLFVSMLYARGVFIHKLITTLRSSRL